MKKLLFVVNPIIFFMGMFNLSCANRISNSTLEYDRKEADKISDLQSKKGVKNVASTAGKMSIAIPKIVGVMEVDFSNSCDLDEQNEPLSCNFFMDLAPICRSHDASTCMKKDVGKIIKIVKNQTAQITEISLRAESHAGWSIDHAKIKGHHFSSEDGQIEFNLGIYKANKENKTWLCIADSTISTEEYPGMRSYSSSENPPEPDKVSYNKSKIKYYDADVKIINIDSKYDCATRLLNNFKKK